ncbi:MAG: hypothetical protein R3E66_06665 [bacterium]
MEFNHIYIVESLFDEDESTGTRLAERLRSSVANNNKQLKIDFLEVENAKSFFATLEKISERAGKEGLWPILHLEIHGHKGGLELGSGEIVEWKELAPKLSKINYRTRNNLFLTLAVCSGAWLAQVLNATQPAPFWGLVGPDQPEWNGVLLDGYEPFYDELLNSLDGDKALEALRQKAKDQIGNSNFLFFSAERALSRTLLRSNGERRLTSQSDRASFRSSGVVSVAGQILERM